MKLHVDSLRLRCWLQHLMNILTFCGVFAQPEQEKGLRSEALWLHKAMLLLIRRAVTAGTGATARFRTALHIGEQRRLRPDDLGQCAPSADLIAPDRDARGRTAHTDRADHLVAVDDDRQAAGIGEIAEGVLAQLRRAALQ